jgi:hypothetical protein
MDKWNTNPKEDSQTHISSISYIHIVVGICIACIIYILYVITNAYPLDSMKDDWKTWINRVRFNMHVSNGTFYT